MPRCPSDNKFVSYAEEPEVEVQSEDVDDEGNVFIEVMVTLACYECGDELRQGYLTLETEVTHDCPVDEALELAKLAVDEDPGNSERLEALETAEIAFNERTYHLNDVDAQPLAHLVTVTPRGKPIKNPWQTLYGATVTGTASCSACDNDISFEGQVMDEAAAFEDLN